MSGRLEFRVAGPAEQASLEALQRAASLVWADDREAILAHPDAIELPLAQLAAGGVIVAERGGSVLGFVVVLAREDGDADLDGLFVDPACWRAGVGRALVGQGVALARRGGARQLHVVANPQALGFYRALGFVSRAEVQTRFRPAPHLTLDLGTDDP